MASEPRHHHYLPQCYLRGFTKSGAKNSKVHVLDAERKAHYSTSIRNVGGVRDFNRVEIEGLDPNIVEKEMGQFESRLATSIRSFESSARLSGEDRTYIFNLIALLAVRSPQRREHHRAFIEQISKKTLSLMLRDEATWRSQLDQMEAAGRAVSRDVAFDEVKDFHRRGEYDVVVNRGHHIRVEAETSAAVLETLAARNWVIIRTNEKIGQFITTDNPVNLVWKDAESIPPIQRDSPGFGMASTELQFPVTRNIAVTGEFDGPTGTIAATTELVALMNAKMAIMSYDQIFAPRTTVPIVNSNREFVDFQALITSVTTT